MSTDITRLLTEWGFSANIIANFVAEDIEIEQLNILTEEDLKLLIPFIGPRRKFQNKLKKYLCESSAEEEQQMCLGDSVPKKKLKSEKETFLHLNKETVTGQNIVITTEQESQNTIQQQPNAVAVTEQQQFVNIDNVQNNGFLITIPGPDTPSEYSNGLSINDAIECRLKHHTDGINDYDLEGILKKSDDGLFLLRSYKNEGKLNNDLRNKLAKIIVSNELSSNINNNITSDRASFLNNHVKKLFPTEEKSVWYIKHKKGESQGRGKILIKYYSTRRKLIKVGLLNLKDVVQDDPDSELSNDENDNTLHYKECLLWLKNNSKPWQKIQDYWSFTSKKRIKALLTDKQSCYEYMTQFPALSDSLGYLLLKTDFETLHPGCNLKLYVAWPKLSAFILDKVKSKAKNRLDNVLTPDGCTVATLSLISHLFPVITVKKEQPRNWRPSREECEEGFFLHVKIIADFETRLQERTNKLHSFGLTSQPIAVIVGPNFDEIGQCFVVINKYRYEVETPLKAIDFVLKSCNALNIRYPFEVGQVFMFLQRAVYEFETAWDRQKNSQLTTAVLARIQEYKLF